MTGSVVGRLRGRKRPRHRDRGIASLEIAIVIVIGILALWLVLYGWKVTRAVGVINDTAAEAARLASVVPADERDAVVEELVDDAIARAGLVCLNGDNTVTSTDGSTAERPLVTVTVTCKVDRSEFSMFAFNGDQLITSAASEPVDRFYGGDA